MYKLQWITFFKWIIINKFHWIKYYKWEIMNNLQEFSSFTPDKILTSDESFESTAIFGKVCWLNEKIEMRLCFTPFELTLLDRFRMVKAIMYSTSSNLRESRILWNLIRYSWNFSNSSASMEISLFNKLLTLL